MLEHCAVCCYTLLMHILVTGGSGFIGSRLTEGLIKEGHAVTVLDVVPPRQSIPGVSFVKADLMRDPVPSVCGEVDGIIHLAGVSIFKRWTPSYKQLIIDSRVKTAGALFEFMKNAPKRPSVFVSASAVGFYGDRGEEALTEASVAGKDFLASVCQAWEDAAKQFQSLGIRTVSVRTAIVLGPGGGMMSQVIPLFRYGIGGRMGSGKQWFSWIHVDDLVRVYTRAVTDGALSGPVNASSPGAVRNKDFARALGRALHRPAIVPAPSFALRVVLGEFASAVLSSARVVPQTLQQKDFTFLYPDIDSALGKSV